MSLKSNRPTQLWSELFKECPKGKNSFTTAHNEWCQVAMFRKSEKKTCNFLTTFPNLMDDTDRRIFNKANKREEIIKVPKIMNIYNQFHGGTDARRAEIIHYQNILRTKSSWRIKFNEGLNSLMHSAFKFFWLSVCEKKPRNTLIIKDKHEFIKAFCFYNADETLFERKKNEKNSKNIEISLHKSVSSNTKGYCILCKQRTNRECEKCKVYLCSKIKCNLEHSNPEINIKFC